MNDSLAISPIARAKGKLTVLDLGALFFPGWKAGRSCKSPFREERHPSFSVFDDGKKWMDFATSEHGDALDFLAKARGLTNSDAAREFIALAGAGGPTAVWGGRTTNRYQKRSLMACNTAAMPMSGPLPAMPKTCRKVWDEGLTHVTSRANLQDVLDGWRSWPTGTARTLADSGLMGCPIVGGQRGVGFVVQAPYRDELGFVSTSDIGFHVRHKPADTHARPGWSYVPSCPALPFVLGGGFITFAHTIIVTEGQFDGVTLASAAGWLASDAAWPETVTVFATRGANAWHPLIEHWGRYWLRDAHFVLFADADEAGARWKAPGGFVETLRQLGHYVRVLCSAQVGTKDLNDYHRIHPVTPAIVAEWITTIAESAR
jgi:hypothetical protein